ncbi:MAG: helix-turn-helix transcriptional regulator [Nostoc sp. DedQUE08]|uniref:PadR family transcriptional regulator n=1 Tax=Nostoc sp. DedQUE08 TaxID=3075393 RepID=UPI002AD217C5|nr:helix-turn-helix transcriptional regulator [Nostoc sp. DedQUE08]MDZ8069038.1 helix-turn-helix transcriptional regulator [Nostoc sp. DedQUE08]
MSSQKNGWQQHPELGEVKSITPTEESILTVLYAYLDMGLYNLHVLDKINQANKRVGKREVSPGTFYPTVKRLEADGLIEGFWKEEVLPGVRRRYLKISAFGVKALTASRQYRDLLSEGKFGEGEEGLLEPGLFSYIYAFIQIAKRWQLGHD